MVHKKYTYKNGKKFGPYYYETNRVNGKVVTTYLGSSISGRKENRKNYNKIIYPMIFILIFGVLLLFFVYSGLERDNYFSDFSDGVFDFAGKVSGFFTGLVVGEDDFVDSGIREEDLDSKASSGEVQEIIEEDSGNVEVVAEDEPADVSDDLRVEETEASVNEEIVVIDNSTGITEANIGEELTPEDIGEETNVSSSEVVVENDSIVSNGGIGEEKISVGDIMDEEIVQANETEVLIVNETLVSNLTGQIVVNTTQFNAVLGMPVRWFKKIGVNSSVNLTIEIPLSAGNLTIRKVLRQESEQNESVKREVEIDLEEKNKGKSEISGEIEDKIEENNTEVITEENETLVVEEQGFEELIENVANESVVEKEDKKREEEIQKKGKEEKVKVDEEIGSEEKMKEISEVKISITGEITFIESSEKGFNFFDWLKKIFRFTGFLVENESSNVQEIIIEISETEEAVEIEYYTDAPYIAFEENVDNGKRVGVTGPDDVHYENVLIYMDLSESLGVVNAERVRIYWRENGTYLSVYNLTDLDENRIYDYIEWIAPQLSNQTFDIIVITKAEHLDSNREFISDIYDDVKELDGNWSEEIPSGDYARVTFERNLTFDRDITIYPRASNLTNISDVLIDVFEFNGNESIAQFSNLSENSYNKIYLDRLGNRTQDTFDFRVLNGGLEFEHIIDPFIIGSKIKIYNFSDLSDKRAWCVLAGFDTPFVPAYFPLYVEWNATTGTNRCSNSYSNLAQNDANRDNDDGITTFGSYWVNHWYNFTIKEPVNSIESIEVKWIGYDQLTQAGDFEFDIWNYSSSLWHVINTTSTSQSSDKTYGMVFNSTQYDLNKFINSAGNLHLGVSGDKTFFEPSPLIYSFTGKEYKYEGDVLAGQDSKRKEGVDSKRLHYLSWEKPRIKVSNELKEIEYIDYLVLNVTYLDWKTNEEFSVLYRPYNLDKNISMKINNIDEDYLVLREGDEYFLEFINLDIKGTKIVTKEMVASGYYEKLQGWKPLYKKHHTLFTNYVEVKVVYDDVPPLVSINSPANNSFISTVWTLLNATVDDPEGNNLTAVIYGEFKKSPSYEYMLSYQDLLSDSSDVLYNWSSMPVNSSESGLFLMYRFDNNSVYGENLTYVNDFSSSNLDGIISGVNGSMNKGIFGKALKIDPSERIQLTSTGDDILTSPNKTRNITIMLWINITDLAAPTTFPNMVVKQINTNNRDYALFWQNSSRQILASYGNGVAQSSSTTNTVFDKDIWYHYAVTYDASTRNQTHYVNGVVDKSSILGTAAALMNTSGTLTIGSTSANNYFSFIIDELAILNRTLSKEEILDYYQLREGTYYWKVNVTDLAGNQNESVSNQFTIDINKPYSIILNSPTNASSFVQEVNISFNWTAFDTVDVSLDCNFSLDSIINRSNLVSPNNTMVNITVTGFSVGLHYWDVTCWDDSFNFNVSETRWFTINSIIDIIPPNLSIYFPNNNSLFGPYNLKFNFNVSLNENGSVSYSFNDGTQNFSLLNTADGLSTFGTLLNRTNSSLGTGIYIMNFYANDTAGNRNYTQSRTFRFDGTAPNITFQGDTPANGSVQSYNSAIVNVSSADWNDHYTLVDFDRDLTLWMRMDDLNNSGDVLDLSSWSANGTVLQGVILNGTGYFGNGSSYTGISEYLEILDGTGGHLDFHAEGDYTWSVWVNYLPTSTFECLFSKSDSDFGTGFGICLGGAPKRIGICSFSGTISCQSSSPISTDLGNWFHLTVVYNGTDNTWNVYENAVLLSTITNSLSSDLITNYYVGAGVDELTDSQSPKYFFNGTLDEFLIFNRSLSSQEIKALYNSSNSTNGFYRNFTGLLSGLHSIDAYGVDILANINNTEKRAFSINVAPNSPVMVLFNSTNGANTTSQNLNARINISDLDSAFLNLTVNWYNETIIALTQVLNDNYDSGTIANVSLSYSYTKKGQNWSVGFISNDGFVNSTQKNSSSIFIKNSAPNALTIEFPESGFATTDRTPEFTLVAVATDDDTEDGASLSHLWNFTCFSGCLPGNFLENGGNKISFSPTDDLLYLKDNGFRYNVSVRSTDGHDNSSWSSVVTINISALVALSLNVSSINFGNIGFQQSNDTSDNSPGPLVLQNDGNSFANVTVHATSALWNTQLVSTSYFRFKIDNHTSEVGAFLWALSFTAYLDIEIVTPPPVASIAGFNYSDSKDLVEIDINITVPPDEGSASRHTDIAFTASLAECAGVGC